MLDKTSKKLLKYLSICKSNQHFYYDEFPDDLGDDDTIFATIRYLKALNYVEILTNQNEMHIGVRLSHISMHKREFSFIFFLEYMKEKWVSILALVISILAFIGAYRKELAAIIQAIT